jgi:hypothetical protein
VGTENQGPALSWRQTAEIGLEAVMQMLPYVGSPLATLYFSTQQERRYNRLRSLYQELADDLKTFKEKIPPINAHTPEALVAIIETFNEKVEREHLAEKRKMLKNFLKKTLFHPITTIEDYDERKSFLETLAGMTLLELQILGRLYPNIGEVSFQDLRPHTIDQHAVRGAIGRLESYGFTLVVPPGNPGDPVYLESEDDYRRKNVRLTDFGRKFCKSCLDE